MIVKKELADTLIGSLVKKGHQVDAHHRACIIYMARMSAFLHFSTACLTSLNEALRLMDVVFTPKNPILRLSQQDNEQMGFMLLYQGVMQAIRNHYAHNDTTIDPTRALEWLGFISALFYKLDKALPSTLPNSK